MMGTQSHLEFLSLSLSQIPVQGAILSKNATSSKYFARDISEVTQWPEFNYNKQ